MTLQVTSHRHIEFLIRPPQLHIGIHSHRVVSLKQGVKELMQSDGGAASVALGKIIFGQHLAHRGCSQQTNHLGQIKTFKPFTIASYLQPSGSLKIEQRLLLGLSFAQLAQICGRVGLHLFGCELHARGALARWIADPGREITNDQHGCMARILKGAQLAKQNAVAQVNITSRWVNAQLHPQRTTLRFSRGQASS